MINSPNEKIVEKNQSPIYTIADRPSWDEYFIFLSFGVALRSDDRFIKHGSVIVHDDSKHIVGTGYNNTIAGMPDSISNPEDREARRDRMKHAEDNAIKNCSEHPKRSNSKFTIYITGIPCLICLEDIVQVGISRIVGIDRVGTITDTSETDKVRNKILNVYNNKIVFDKISMENKWVQKGLSLLT